MVVAMISNLKPADYGFVITSDALELGSLRRPSRIRVDKIDKPLRPPLEPVELTYCVTTGGASYNFWCVAAGGGFALVHHLPCARGARYPHRFAGIA